MKKNYIEPAIQVAVLSDNILDVIPQGSPTDDFSKENMLNFEETDGNSENDERPVNLWDD